MKMERFELKLANGKVVEWEGSDGENASRRYVDCHREAAVVAWRYPRYTILVGTSRIEG
jgi:hypothetical protein